MTGKEFAGVCSGFVNAYNADIEGFAKAMACEHRTLQQSFTRMIVEYLKLQAQERDDARNQASIDFSKKVVKMLEKDNIAFPMI